MKTVHTSPKEITEINENGLFGDCLFFAEEEYAMGNVKAVYELEINNVIEACQIDDEVGFKEISEKFGIDADLAIEVLCGDTQIGHITGDYEDNWFVQKVQAQSAKRMGFEGVESDDEQGVVFIIPMLNREKDLLRVR
ncbi:hypothetical protein KA005_04040 [bacterium]|nr:hypothetical protein [bacterium]